MTESNFPSEMDQKAFVRRLNSVVSAWKESHPDKKESDLCTAAGVPNGTISNARKANRKGSSIFALSALMNYLDVSVDWLMGFSKTKSKPKAGDALLDLNACAQFLAAKKQKDKPEFVGLLLPSLFKIYRPDSPDLVAYLSEMGLLLEDLEGGNDR